MERQHAAIKQQLALAAAKSLSGFQLATWVPAEVATLTDGNAAALASSLEARIVAAMDGTDQSLEEMRGVQERVDRLRQAMGLPATASTPRRPPPTPGAGGPHAAAALPMARSATASGEIATATVAAAAGAAPTALSCGAASHRGRRPAAAGTPKQRQPKRSKKAMRALAASALADQGGSAKPFLTEPAPASVTAQPPAGTALQRDSPCTIPFLQSDTVHKSDDQKETHVHVRFTKHGWGFLGDRRSNTPHRVCPCNQHYVAVCGSKIIKA